MSKQQLVVEVSGLKKRYSFKPILSGIDFTLARGERMALLGANGVGKTTLLRLLAGLTKADAGRLYVAGYDIAHDVQQVRRLVGLVAHQPYLYEELTALENLLFFGRMYSVEHVRERAQELLQRVGLERRMHERMRTLSRGQVQRLSWARALLHTPLLLLLDEPETGLDQQGHELIDGLLAEHTERGGTTLFSTHQIERALTLADRLLIISGGRIVYQESTVALTPGQVRQIYHEVAG